MENLILFSVLFSSIVILILFILKGFAIFEMSNSLGLNKNFLGFVPLVSNFQFGRIAEQHLKKNGSKPAKFSLSLLILVILEYIAIIAFVVTFVFALVDIYGFAEQAVLNDTSMKLSDFASIIPSVVCYFILLALAVAHTIVNYVAFYKTCCLFNKNNAVVFTILSVLFPFLFSVFLFVIRNNKPDINSYEQ